MYGETSGMLRAALGELLRQHRIQQRIGGAGPHTVPETTTPEERKVIGEQIARYRYAVLVWSHQAMRAANPRINLEGSTGRTRGPAEELRYRLEATLAVIEVDLPTMGELVAEQPFALVDTWRRAARACVLGEHDFANGVGYGRLSEAQRLTVIKDAADVVRAVVGLDRRYANIPGWQALKGPGRLGRAAESCATWAGCDEPDYTVDLRGWRPEPTLIEGPGLPGITGVLQAQHNLLIHLGTFPTAHNLRVVLDSQRIVSRETARRLQPVDPTVAVRWERRAETYGRLVHETRDLGGMVGNGGPAAGQGSVAAVRMEKLDRGGLSDAPQVRRLQRVSAGIDDRICNVIEQGVAQRLYFQRINVPGLDHNGELVRVTRQKFVSITSPVRPNCSRSCAATCGPHLSNERRRKVQRKAASTSRQHCIIGHQREERAQMSRRSDTPSTASSRDKEMPLALVVPFPQDPFLNTEDACRYLGVPKATLLTWRVRRPGYGPRAVKAGGRLKYRLSELDRWLRDHEESFALGDDNEGADPASEGGRQVRSRSRASRVRGGALRTAQP